MSGYKGLGISKRSESGATLTDAEITAMGYRKTDNDTHLTDAEIAAMGYKKTDNDTHLTDAEIAAMGYKKTDNDTHLTDAEIAAMGYVKQAVNIIEDKIIIPIKASSADTYFKLNGLGDEIVLHNYSSPTENWQNIHRSSLMRANQALNAYTNITTGKMSIISKDYRVGVGEITLKVYVGDTITKYLMASQAVNFGINYYNIPLDLTGFGGKLYYNRNYIFYEIVYSQNVSLKTEMKIQLSFE